jgi:protein O-GlcNAc transferase
MSTRMMISVSALCVFVLAGCNGPTKEGIKARSEANARMSLMSAQIHFGQARQSFETGQFDKATREIEQAIKTYSESAEYFVLQGRIALETHKLEQALDSFETALDLDAKLAEPHYYSGVVYQRWSNDQQAYESYAKAFEIAPTKVEYLLAAAESVIALGEFEQAKQLIESKLSYFENNASLRQLQGQIALLQGDAKKAAALYGEARLLNPDDDALLEELMWAQYAAEQYGACHESAKQLTSKLKSPRADLIHLQARCMTMMNRGPEARELYIELSKLRPADADVWSELGTLCWDLGDYRRVAQCSVQLTSLSPERYEGYLLRGVNEKQKGNVAEAIEMFRLSSERAPEVALPHMLLGQALEQTGAIEQAKLAYAGAVKAQPSSTEAEALLRRLNENQQVSAAPTQ